MIDHNIRVTNSNVFGYPDGAGELRDPYSKTQAWNSDMTKIAVGFNSILNGDNNHFDIVLNVEQIIDGVHLKVTSLLVQEILNEPVDFNNGRS